MDAPAVRSVRVRVPGSSANLGPGFDVLAAALGLFLEVDVIETGSFAVVTDLQLRTDRQNLIVRGFEKLLPAEGFEFRVRSEIPLSGGMGSSAAGVVAGLLAAAALRDGPDGAALGPDRGAPGPEGVGGRLLALATEIEGHPDNVAASLFGGLVICDGAAVERLRMPEGVEAVLVVPHISVSTSQARAALPEQVPLADAVANLAAVAKLTLGLERGDWRLVADALRDRLHQPHRAHLYPRAAALLDSAPALGALGATISGAGPTVLVWCLSDSAPLVAERLAAETRAWASVVRAPFASEGARVLGG